MAILDNLVSWWDLEEASGTRSDAHGSNDLTDVNTVTSGTGVTGDTASDHERDNKEILTIADASQSGLTLGASDFTIAFWLKPETDVNQQDAVSKFSVASSGKEFIVRVDALANSITFYYSTNGTTETGITSDAVTLNAGTWYLIIITRSGANINFYVNDTAYGGGALSGGAGTTLADTGSTFSLGGSQPDDQAGGSQNVDGLLDSVGIWVGEALGTTDRSTLYNSGSGVQYADISVTGVTVTPSAQVLTASIPTYSVNLGLTVTPSAQVATFSIPAYTVSLPKTVSVGVQTATFSIPVYSIDAGGNKIVNVTAQVLTASIPTYAIQTGTTVTPSAQVATFSTPTPTLSLGSGVTITPAAQVATLSIPTPSITTTFGVIISVATQVLTFSLPALSKVGAVWTKVARGTSASWSRRNVNSD